MATVYAVHLFEGKRIVSILIIAQWRGSDKYLGVPIVLLYLDQDFRMDTYLQLKMALYIFHDVWLRICLVKKEYHVSGHKNCSQIRSVCSEFIQSKSG